MNGPVVRRWTSCNCEQSLFKDGQSSGWMDADMWRNCRKRYCCRRMVLTHGMFFPSMQFEPLLMIMQWILLKSC